MILEELLTYVGKEHLDDRTDLVDGEADSLWSDETIVRYLNEGQRILCRRSWVLVEIGQTPAGTIVLVQDKVLYPLHKSVLRVFDATYDADATPLQRLSDDAIRGRVFVDPEIPFNPDAYTVATPGRPIAMATDAGTRMLRLDRAPTATEAGKKLTLKIARLPICPLDAAKPEESPEIPEEWHLQLADYAVARCLMLPNVDSAAKVDGRLMLATWDRVVHEAKQERMRAEMSHGAWCVNTTTAVLG